MDLMELLTSQLANPETLGKLGKTVNAKPKQVQKVAQLGLPALLEALSRNASTAEGAAGLARALEQHQDDDVDDLDNFLGKVDTNDGAKILSHIFGGKTEKVQSGLAKKSGMDMNQVMGLMTQFAPLVLGLLGKQKKQENLDENGVANMTSSLTGALSQIGGGNLMNMATKLLDSDNDGNILDDVGNLLGGFFGKK